MVVIYGCHGKSSARRRVVCCRGLLANSFVFRFSELSPVACQFFGYNFCHPFQSTRYCSFVNLLLLKPRLVIAVKATTASKVSP